VNHVGDDDVGCIGRAAVGQAHREDDGLLVAFRNPHLRLVDRLVDFRLDRCVERVAHLRGHVRHLVGLQRGDVVDRQRSPLREAQRRGRLARQPDDRHVDLDLERAAALLIHGQRAQVPGQGLRGFVIGGAAGRAARHVRRVGRNRIHQLHARRVAVARVAEADRVLDRVARLHRARGIVDLGQPEHRQRAHAHRIRGLVAHARVIQDDDCVEDVAGVLQRPLHFDGERPRAFVARLQVAQVPFDRARRGVVGAAVAA